MNKSVYVGRRQHNDCGICVAAMVTGCSWEFCNRRILRAKCGGVTTPELVRFLFTLGYPVGLWEILSATSAGGKELDLEVCEVAMVPFKNYRGVVTVKSKLFPGKLHFIYWDGKGGLYDSGRPVEDEPKFSDYETVSWLPIPPKNHEGIL